MKGLRGTLLFLTLLAVGAGRAQEAGDYDGLYRFDTGTGQVVFSDTALVRAAPAGSVQDTLYAFAAVRIKRRLPQLLTVGRKTAPWYEIRYEVQGHPRDGILWGGALAASRARRDGVDFAFSILSYPQAAEAGLEPEPAGDGFNTCAIKARAGTGAIQQCLYNVHPESGYFVDTGRDEAGKPYHERFGKAGSLPTGARFLIHFYLSGEACGIPFYQLSAAWDGVRLVRMPLLEGNADAGAFEYEEGYVYPTPKSGKPGHLAVRGVSTEYDERERATRTVTTRYYRWDEPVHRFTAVK